MRTPAVEILEELTGRADAMIEHLRAVVEHESPSVDPAAVARCGAVVEQIAHETIGAAPERIAIDGWTHLLWTFGPPRVVLLGHIDTVWPRGTIDRWPFSASGGRASGPGIFDMKAGVVQGLHALSLVGDPGGAAVLLTADEELGSPSSRALVEEVAAGAEAVLVLEPSARGAVKVARKGGSLYQLHAHGRAAHAGLDPTRGINAVVELAHQILALEEIARPDLGTTVTPTVASAGITTNTVPATASVAIDVRAGSLAEQERVDRALRELAPVLEGAGLALSGGINRPPLERSASTALFARARAAAEELGLPALEGAVAGGGSDGNFTAALGVSTLDGLGAVGDGAHAEGEHVEVAALPERAALVTLLVEGLLRVAEPGP